MAAPCRRPDCRVDDSSRGFGNGRRGKRWSAERPIAVKVHAGARREQRMFTLTLIGLAAAAVPAIFWLYRLGLAARAAGIAWICFAAYEIGFRATCIGDGNIRVDWVLLLPVLLLVSAAAAVSLARDAWRRRSRKSR
jgi:hypothetical protein